MRLRFCEFENHCFKIRSKTRYSRCVHAFISVYNLRFLRSRHLSCKKREIGLHASKPVKKNIRFCLLINMHFEVYFKCNVFLWNL